MKLLVRTFSLLFAAGLAFVLIPTSPASGADDCAPKCKAAQAACDQGCDAQKLVCIGRCGGPAPLGDAKCNEGCATARTDCGNTCQVTELACEGKCLIPLPLPR
jgi:hypothetical protein